MTELNKIELFEKGYTIFNIYNLNDVEINNALDELYTLSKKKFNCLRYCRLHGMGMSHLKDEFEKLEKEKQIQLKNDLYEIWYYKDVDKTKFRKPILNKIKSFFYNEEIENMNHACQISMYNDGCYLIEHNDGYNPTPKYKCAILVYLNKKEEIKNGGELVLEGNIKIKPIIGTVVVLDFTKNDVKHGVTQVSGYERKCFLNFC